MKSPSALSAALLLFALVCQVRGQEPLSDADKALFDDLKVTEEAEKTARERIGKSAPPPHPQPELPAAAAKLLDRLAVFEASLSGVTDESVGRSRKTLSTQLIKLSDTTADPAKTELITTAKNIEGLQADAPLPQPPAAGDFPGEWIYGPASDSRWHYRDGKMKTKDFTGTWRWLNQSNTILVADYAGAEFVDILRIVTKPGKPPILEGLNQNADRWTLSRGRPDTATTALPAEARKLITVARAYEAQTRSNTSKQSREKRERVAQWLVEHAKSEPPAPAKLLLENAALLRAAAPSDAGLSALRNPDPFRGNIYADPKRRTWEFLPNGTVRSNGISWGIWEWGKAANDTCLVICSGKPGRAENPMIVRQSGKEPGLLHFIGFDDKFDAKLKP